MIRQLSFGNFKSFKHQPAIDLAPISIFIGPNNSGKSTILQTLLLIKQTVECRYDELAVDISGPYYDFGTYKDMVFGNDLKRHISMSITADRHNHVAKNNDTVGWTFEIASKNGGKQITVRRFGSHLNDCKMLDVRFNPRSEISRADIAVPEGGRKTIRRKQTLNELFYRSNFAVFFANPHAFMRILGHGILSGAKASSKLTLNNNQAKLLKNIQQQYYDHTLRGLFRSMSYVGPLREAPQRLYSYRGHDMNLVGVKGENFFAVLSRFSDRRSQKSKAVRRQIAKWLRLSGLAKNVEIKQISPRHFEVRVLGISGTKYQNLVDVGFGNSQVLPIAIDALQSRPGSVHIYEQPEIHLHPKAQCALADLLVTLKRNGAQAIVETHSFELILRLKRMLASGRIRHQDLVIYYVDQKNGLGRIKKLILDENLAFTNWPKGFFEERYNESHQLTMQMLKKHHLS